MKDQELLLQAIDNYNLIPPTGQNVLKTLVRLAVDDMAVTNAKELNKLCKIARPTIYQAFKLLEEKGFIECHITKGSRSSSFVLKPHRLEKIIEHYTAKKNLLIE
jgi:hypothetical protein